jgi:hypothetical protein
MGRTGLAVGFVMGRTGFAFCAKANIDIDNKRSAAQIDLMELRKIPRSEPDLQVARNDKWR